MTLFYNVLAPIDQPWKVFVHFEGASGRAGRGDHEPIDGRCPATVWQPGDYIVDRFTARIDDGEARRTPGGVYRIWIGLFTGVAPRWKNMPVSDAASDMYDPSDRVRIATVILE